jgi:hypothetical protein
MIVKSEDYFLDLRVKFLLMIAEGKLNLTIGGTGGTLCNIDA